MNKKISVLIFLSLILIVEITLLAFTTAQEVPGIEEAPLVKDIQEGQEKIREIQEAQDKTAYLKQEWEKLLEKNKGGQILIKISNFFKNFSPIFKIVLGIEYSLSWSFIFALVIWFMLFLFLTHPLSAILGNSSLGILASLVVASLIGIAGVIKKAVEILTLILNNFWIALLSLIIAAILALVFERLGMKLKRKIKQKKEEAEKEKTERSQKLIQTQGKIAKKELESYK